MQLLWPSLNINKDKCNYCGLLSFPIVLVWNVDVMTRGAWPPCKPEYESQYVKDGAAGKQEPEMRH